SSTFCKFPIRQMLSVPESVVLAPVSKTDACAHTLLWQAPGASSAAELQPVSSSRPDTRSCAGANKCHNKPSLDWQIPLRPLFSIPGNSPMPRSLQPKSAPHLQRQNRELRGDRNRNMSRRELDRDTRSAQ